MKYLIYLSLSFALVVSTFVIAAFGQAAVIERDPAKEAPIYAELQKRAPKAVETFKAATEAMDSGRPEEAAQLYNKVLIAAPDFDPALRRLGYALVSQGLRDEGIKSVSGRGQAYLFTILPVGL